MSDIVERLRERAASGVNCLCGNPVCEEAATEILRLRAENEKLRAVLRESDQNFMRVDMERMKLRAALNPFVTAPPPDARPDDYDWLMVRPEDIRAAAAALKETGE